MAAAAGVEDSYHFLRSTLSKHNVLVVGDGNFSFSLSLAKFRDEFKLNSHLVLTSFDSKEILERHEVTKNNLECLQRFENVEILHNIDATKLSEYFSNRKFERIIFNFPHTGGKSNIKKCRKLLEDFFTSGVQHIESYGDICITLCKGQGGTPIDEPKRTYGNSWQIVNNAAKAGLILNQLHPFLDSDYAHYKSVGYRGKLTKGFHTVGGLIHIFKSGIRLDSIEDLSGQTTNALLSYACNQYSYFINTPWCSTVTEHPIQDLKNTILVVLNNVTDTSFEEIQQNNVDEAGRGCLFGYKTGYEVNYNTKILLAITKTPSFILTGTSLTICNEITNKSSVVMRYLAICKLYDCSDETYLEKAVPEEKEILNKLMKILFIEQEYVSEVDSERTTKCINTNLKELTWTNSSEVFHLARSKCQLKSKADLDSNVKCTCETLAHAFLRNDTRIGCTQQMPIELLDQKTIKQLKISSTVVGVSGHLKTEILRDTEHTYGWLIFINIDALAMMRYNISDIRMLSSVHLKWKENPIMNEKENVEQRTFIPVPINLFPPEHVHDISFWVSHEVSQELFFFIIIALTKNCVKEVKLTEIYHDEDKHCLSFNYRMIYSRIDGPLSHLEAVELQNRLRRALIALGFGLK